MAVGRLVPVKRYDHLIRAVALARQRHPRLTLTIVGEGYEREALDEVVPRGRRRRTGCGSPATSPTPSWSSLYRRAWLVTSASAREGWGMSLTEAAACGTPAVATRIPGHTDAVVDGETGVLVERDDDQALGDAIADLLARRRTSRPVRGGRPDPAAAYSWEATAAGIMRVLAAEAERRRR